MAINNEQSSTKNKSKRQSSGRPRDSENHDETNNIENGTNTRTETTGIETNTSGNKTASSSKRTSPWWRKNKNKTTSQTGSNNGKIGQTLQHITYSGRYKGSIPVKRSASVNIELSQYCVLIRQTYNILKAGDPTIVDRCPFPIFQHYCTTILSAYVYDYARTILKFDVLLKYDSPLDLINSKQLLIPKNLKEFISSIGSSISPGDELVQINIPQVAIPQGPTSVNNVETVPSGTFGIITARNHNVYECYICPRVTAQYIIASGENGDLPPLWHPLNEYVRPQNAIPTENLLGYWPRVNHSIIARREMNRCQFESSSSILGRLCYSQNVMDVTSATLSLMKKDAKMETCDFKFKETQSIFIVKDEIKADANVIPVPTERLVSVSTRLFSPYGFGSSCANMAHYYGLRRKRSIVASGTCYVTEDGINIAGWNLERNRNFNQNEPFGPAQQLETRQMLNEDIHFESSSTGFIERALTVFFEKSLKVELDSNPKKS